jgi:hypothetical protein
LLDSLLDSLAASSSFNFLLWPLKREERQNCREYWWWANRQSAAVRVGYATARGLPLQGHKQGHQTQRPCVRHSWGHRWGTSHGLTLPFAAGFHIWRYARWQRTMSAGQHSTFRHIPGKYDTTVRGILYLTPSDILGG